ncbi:MAG: hypothetical protein CM15mP83_8010 [Flavobacteriaceae bacterium]|nr:MAG: hypothetical protein CM15mP83_8010 [Flavobacteriaceae bacterium]
MYMIFWKHWWCIYFRVWVYEEKNSFLFVARRAWGFDHATIFWGKHWFPPFADAGFSNVESFRYGSKGAWAGTLILKGEK